MKVLVTVPTKTVPFAATMSVPMMETTSVASFVSVQGEVSYDHPPRSTELTLSAKCVNAEKRGLSSSEFQRSNCEALEVVRLKFGSKCSNSSQERQQSLSDRLKQQRPKLELESKRMKIQVEQYQR